MGKRIPIGPGTKVMLNFTLKLPSGEIIDSTGSKPAVFEVGDGNLLPGFEKALFGMRPNDEAVLEIPPKEAFGEPNEENIQRFKRSQFQANMELAVGLMMSFSDAQNSELPGVIVAIDEDYVDVDFNHPLAGKTITFEVKVISVTQVTNEILRVKH